jgi:excisionase family DNA binding protein
MDFETQLLTVKEVAVLTRFTPRTLSRWRVAGKGPKFVRLGSAIRYKKADVETWIAQLQGATSTAQARLHVIS